MSSRFVFRVLPACSILVAGMLLFPAPGAAQLVPHVPTPESALTLVDTLRGQGDFREARSRLTTLRSQYGDYAGILWRLSLTHGELARTANGRRAVDDHRQKALALADKALMVDSLNAHVHLSKAVAEQRLTLTAGTEERVQRYRAVKAHADRAIELDSTLDGAYQIRARWHHEVADLDFFQRVFLVPVVYGGLPDASFEESVRDYKRAIELHDERFYHLELAKTYLEMGRRAEAEKELMTVLDLPPVGPFDERYGDHAREILNDFE